ncbi:formyltransferase family protein [Prevotella disiens]|uniref:formyltransferase family protein n=1 Tax=Prevotella disiens TaxID=28130 RepID=UPI00242FC0FE|nr:formyltransferase family protein [Prevotella disiens]
MKIKILGNKNALAYNTAQRLLLAKGHTISEETNQECDLAIAPLLTEKVPTEQLNTPKYGTLIFHPSPLPYGRGATSIKWAYKRHEPITAATWFWADNGLDTGDICEQEIVKINYQLRPREFYEQHIIPAMERTLERCLNALSIGFKRTIPQVEQYSSFDKK